MSRKRISLLFVLFSVVSIQSLIPVSVHASEARVQALLEDAVSRNRGGRGGGLLRIAWFDGANNQRCSTAAFVAGRRAGPDSPLVTVDTPYGIASITKTFVATLTLIYVERGLLDLDAPISGLFDDKDWLLGPVRNKGVRENLRRATARQLLSHRSGLPDYWHNHEFFKIWEAEKDKYWSHSELLYWAGRMGRECAVDKCFSYSDTNYLVLGMALEKKLGKKLHTLLRQEIFEPLNMRCSWMYFEEGKPNGCKPVAHSYEKRLDVTRNRMQSADWASGGIYSTLEDQNAFFGDLFFDNKLLSETSRAEMLTWRRSNWNRRTQYGLGIYRVKLGKGMTLVGHEGYHNAFSFLWQEADIIFTGSLNQESSAALDALLYPVIRALKKEGLSDWRDTHSTCAGG